MQVSSQVSPNFPLLVVVQTLSAESQFTSRFPEGAHSASDWQAAPVCKVPRYAESHAEFWLPHAGFACSHFRQATADALSKMVFGVEWFHEAVSTSWQVAALYW
jgi:hypothetical protein